MKGPLEVAGPGAQVVLANPNGITCDGCAFINATRTTLATGTPRYGANGSLDALLVQGGSIAVDGRGMDASRTSQLDLLASHIRVNAGLWAQYVKAVAGPGEVPVSADGTDPAAATPTAAPPAPPDYRVELTELGFINAQGIYLRGTEKGLGFALAGSLRAEKDLILLPNGRLENRASLQAGQDFAAKADEVVNTGQILAGRNLDLQAEHALENEGTLQAGQSLSVGSAQVSNHPKGDIQGDKIEIHARERMHNSGLVDGRDVFIDSQQVQNDQGGRLYADRMAIQASTLINANDASGDAETAPVIAGRDRVDLGVGRLDNRDGALLMSGGDLAIGGAIDSQPDPAAGITVRRASGMAGEVNNDSANIEALGDGRISSRVFNNRNVHLQIGRQQEAPFTEDTVTPAGTTLSFKTSACFACMGMKRHAAPRMTTVSSPSRTTRCTA